MLEIAFLANQRNCKETFLLQPPPINDHQDMPPVNDGHKRFHSHYVKSVRIRRFSGPYFPAFRLNTEIYSPYSVLSPYSVRMRENTEEENC